MSLALSPFCYIASFDTYKYISYFTCYTSLYRVKSMFMCLHIFKYTFPFFISFYMLSLLFPLYSYKSAYGHSYSSQIHTNTCHSIHTNTLHSIHMNTYKYIQMHFIHYIQIQIHFIQYIQILSASNNSHCSYTY